MTRRNLDESGQASLEYLLVGLVLLSLMGMLAALWHFFSTGAASSLIEASTSHAATSVEGMTDALLF